MRSLLLALAVLAGLALSLTRSLPLSPAQPALRAAPSNPATRGFDFVAANVTIAPGGGAVVDLRLRDAVDLAAYEVQLAFDPAVVAVDRVDRLVGTGTPPPAGRTWVALPLSSDPNTTFTTLSPGVIAFGAYSYGDPAAALDGDVLLARLTLRAVGTGTSALHLNTSLVSNPDAQGSAPPSVDGSVTIGGDLCVTGMVRLQSRTNHQGVTIRSGALTTQTATDGSFTLCGFAPGVHTVTAGHPSYLAQTAPAVTLSAETAQVVLPTITLLGGDVYQQDQADRINILDLISIASIYGSPASVRPSADVNGDGTVNLVDLTLVGLNYNSTSETWGAAGLSKREPGAETRAELLAKRPATVWLDQPTAVKAGEVFEVAARTRGAADLAGADLALHFDPARLEALGPVQTGAAWPSEAAFVAANGADNATGEVHFAATTLGGRAAGQGVLLTLRFRARLAGPPGIQLGPAQLVGAEGALLVNIPK